MTDSAGNAAYNTLQKIMKPVTDAIARAEAKCRSFPVRHQDVMDIEDDLRELRLEIDCRIRKIDRDWLLKRIDEILDPSSGIGTHGLEAVKLKTATSDVVEARNMGMQIEADREATAKAMLDVCAPPLVTTGPGGDFTQNYVDGPDGLHTSTGKAH